MYSMSTISAKSDDGSHDFPWFPMVPRPLDETVLLEWWPFATLEPWRRRAGARPWESCARCMREARLERAGSRALFGSCAKRAGNGTWWDWRSSNICTFLNCRFTFLHSVQLHLLGALNTRHACIVYAARSYPCSHPFMFMTRKLASTSRSYSCYSKELDGRSVLCAVFKLRISGLFVVEVTCSIGFELLVGFEPILAWVGVRLDVLVTCFKWIRVADQPLDQSDFTVALSR